MCRGGPCLPFLAQILSGIHRNQSLHSNSIYKFSFLDFTVRIWRKSVRTAKIKSAKVSLEKYLFLLSHVFQSPLQNLQQMCFNLSHSRMHRICSSTVYSLDEFVTEQADRRQDFEKVRFEPSIFRLHALTHLFWIHTSHVILTCKDLSPRSVSLCFSFILSHHLMLVKSCLNRRLL